MTGNALNWHFWLGWKKILRNSLVLSISMELHWTSTKTLYFLKDILISSQHLICHKRSVIFNLFDKIFLLPHSTFVRILLIWYKFCCETDILFLLYSLQFRWELSSILIIGTPEFKEIIISTFRKDYLGIFFQHNQKCQFKACIYDSEYSEKIHHNWKRYSWDSSTSWCFLYISFILIVMHHTLARQKGN